MKTFTYLNCIGAASGYAAQDHGCADGPSVLQKSSYWNILGLSPQWQAMIALEPDYIEKSKNIAIAEWCQKIASQTEYLVRNQKHFVVLGGDHACAIGTWSGCHNAIKDKGTLGLIWIDAHLDSHTPETSETGNIHGMPVAALLGYGDVLFTKIGNKQTKLLPENICLIGVRSYEQGEYELIRKLGIRVYYMEEVSERGIATVLAEAIKKVSNTTYGFGLSIDLDALDPIDAPGVGTPEKNGIRSAALCEALKKYANHPQLLGFEITEFNPHRDKQQITEKLVCELTACLTKDNF